MALPPLRTVRDTPPPRASAPIPATGLRRTGPPSASGNIRGMLDEMLRHDLVDLAAAEEFVAKMGPRLRDLTDRDRIAQAMVNHGLLTAFQMERILACNIFGMVFGNYRIEDRVGGGTVGIVFRARHKHLKRLVAIKVVPADETTPPQFLERFDLEMELLARVDHPHVIRVYDTGVLEPTEPGHSPLRYAVLEHIDGCDLENYVYQHGVVPVPLAAEWGRQLATGLAAAHAHNLVHRDFKPSNVLVTGNRRAKVSDLGLARHFASVNTPRPGIVGSIEFMAPEQTADAATVGPAADVYALGATLFWALTGQLPFAKSANSKEALSQIRTATPRRLRTVDPQLPAELDEMLARMMSRDPSARPTATDVSGWLATLANPSVHPALDGAVLPEAEHEVDFLRFAVTHLEQTIAVRDELAAEAASAVLTALARVAQFRGEPAGTQKRLQEYVRAMAGKLKAKPDWVMLADARFVDDVIRAIPARNVGLVGVPDGSLTGASTPDAQAALERHPLIGCHILEVIVARHGKALPYARVARDVIRHHHEKWDGHGFPDRLKRDQIPHAARLVAVAEAYDALRQPQDGDPGLSHEYAITGLLNESKGFFDPAVIDAMVAAHTTFEAIFASVPD